MTGGAVQGQGDDDPRVSDRHTLGPTIARPRLTPNGAEKAGHGAPWHAGIIDAWGVEPKAGPAGRIGDSRCMKDRKIDAGEAGGSEPLRRLSGRRCGAHCARQCRAKCKRAPQERLHECRERCDRQFAVADARVLGEVHRHVTGTAITSAGGSDGSRAKHAAEDAERSEAASAARRAREGDGAAATPVRKKNGPRHPRCFGE